MRLSGLNDLWPASCRRGKRRPLHACRANNAKRFAVAIEPGELPVYETGWVVKEVAGIGNGERSVSAFVQLDLVSDRKRFSFRPESGGIEPLRHENPVPRKEQVTLAGGTH